MGTIPYVTHLYVPRQPLTLEWLTRLLEHLWSHGLRFANPTPEERTWQAELDSPDFDIQQVHAPSLAQALERIIEKGSCYISMWDDDIPYHLDLAPDPHEDILLPDEEPEEELPIGYISLYCDITRAGIFYPDYDEDETHTPAYLRAYHGYLHWSKILCAFVEPLFAFGDTPYTGLLTEEEEPRIQHLLAQGQLPDCSELLRKDGACYLTPRDAQPERLLDALRIPHCSLERLPNGGVFLSTSYTSLLYENAAGQREIFLGKSYFDRAEREDRHLTVGDLETVTYHFQRALTIFIAIEDVDRIRSTRRYIRDIEEQRAETSRTGFKS